MRLLFIHCLGLGVVQLRDLVGVENVAQVRADKDFVALEILLHQVNVPTYWLVVELELLIQMPARALLLQFAGLKLVRLLRGAWRAVRTVLGVV